MSVDRTDLKIIRSLNENARKSYKKISQETDISDTTVRKRIQKMLDLGIIRKFNVLLDYPKLGRVIKAFIGIRLSPKILQDVVNNLKNNSDVQVLYRTTGHSDLFIEVIVGTMEELNNFLENELNFEGIIGTEVDVVIGPYKRCPCTSL